jgi:hypothetical protein
VKLKGKSMSEEQLLAHNAARLGISVVELKMQMAMISPDGRDVMRDIVSDSYRSNPAQPRSARPARPAEAWPPGAGVRIEPMEYGADGMPKVAPEPGVVRCEATGGWRASACGMYLGFFGSVGAANEAVRRKRREAGE